MVSGDEINHRGIASSLTAPHFAVLSYPAWLAPLMRGLKRHDDAVRVASFERPDIHTCADLDAGDCERQTMATSCNKVGTVKEPVLGIILFCVRCRKVSNYL